MKRRLFLHLLAGTALFAAGLCSGLLAQSPSTTDTPFRVEQKRTDLSGAPDMEVIASIVEIPAGQSGRLHLHHGVEVAYVLQGSRIHVVGKPDPVELTTGATLFNLRDVQHGGFDVLGEQPLKLFTVHIVDKTGPLYDYAK